MSKKITKAELDSLFTEMAVLAASRRDVFGGAVMSGYPGCDEAVELYLTNNGYDLASFPASELARFKKNLRDSLAPKNNIDDEYADGSGGVRPRSDKARRAELRRTAIESAFKLNNTPAFEMLYDFHRAAASVLKDIREGKYPDIANENYFDFITNVEERLESEWHVPCHDAEGEMLPHFSAFVHAAYGITQMYSGSQYCDLPSLCRKAVKPIFENLTLFK